MTMMSDSRTTSFARLLVDESSVGPIRRVEIPLIQRDYAQGRDDPSTSKIRAAFLEVLHDALTGEKLETIGLDFIYGDVRNDDGTLRPLDGQQRLTTLFLLHWYIAHRVSIKLADEPWTAFTYATRASARLFCDRLVSRTPPAECEDPAGWIQDQPWFQYFWRYDPTIQSMLTMITAIHERFSGADLDRAWRRLTDANAPAISFHLLPIQNMGAPEALYIKMNSRGKPLTEFETFKARLEAVIAPNDPQHELAHKIDGVWADIFWPYRGTDDLIDDELLRYMRFLIEVCEWKQGTLSSDAAEPRARALFKAENPRSREHLTYLINAFDTWKEAGPKSYFSALFVAGRDAGSAVDRVPLFVGEGKSNLFESCVTTFGDSRGSTRVFSLGQQLLLCAVIAYRVTVTRDVDDILTRRIRVIRNLIDASENEIRLDRMPAMLTEVENLVLNGLSGDSTSFNRAQFDDELVKAAFLTNHPHLEDAVFRLEDNILLRGSLVAFDLDPESFTRRADAFARAFEEKSNWTSITGAMLAAGSYARPRDRERRSFQFGVGEHGMETAWRTVLTVGSRKVVTATRLALMKVLDAVSEHQDPTIGLASIRDEALEVCETSQEFDWVYYLMKYDSMREGRSGIYFGQDELFGYSLCMLSKTQLNSYYRDPYLLAVWRESNVGDKANDPWFTGYEWNERWLRLADSGVQLRCVREGFDISGPEDERYDASFQRVCTDFEVGNGRLAIPQYPNGTDSHDRVRAGAAFLRALVAAGC